MFIYLQCSTSHSLSSPREYHAGPVLRKPRVLHLLHKQRMWSRNISCIIKQFYQGWVWNQTRKWICISLVTSILYNLPFIHTHTAETSRPEWEPSFITTFIVNFMFDRSSVLLPPKSMLKLSFIVAELIYLFEFEKRVQHWTDKIKSEHLQIFPVLSILLWMSVDITGKDVNVTSC